MSATENLGTCYLWTGYRDHQGYGLASVPSGRSAHTRAHRLAWRITYGPIPDGLHVLHRCDNPPCVRPDHLFLGTHAENMQDMVDKGRARNAAHPGELNPGAKLTLRQVIEIRVCYHEYKLRQKAIALAFQISPRQVGRIVRGERWK